MNKKGFTLIELLVTISLIGLLIVIAVPTGLNVSKKIKQSMLATKIEQIESGTTIWGQTNKDDIAKKINSNCQIESITNNNKVTNCTRVTLSELLEKNIFKEDKIIEIEGTNKKVLINPVNNESLNDCAIEVYIKNKKVYAKFDMENGVCNQTTIPEAPTLAFNWYNSNEIPKENITLIRMVTNIEENLLASSIDNWPAAVDADNDGTLDDDITCYINGTTLTIAGNGSDKIMANENSMTAFSRFLLIETIENFKIFDTSKVTNMDKMFMNCPWLYYLDLSNFKTHNVTTMEGIFAMTGFETLDLSGFDTSSVNNEGNGFFEMFAYSYALTSVDLSSFNTNTVTDMHYMFYECRSLKTIYVSNKFKTEQVTNSSGMFYNCSNLIGGNETTYNSSFIDKTYARIDTEATPGYFTLK